MSIATLVLACAITPAQAGVNTWTTNGPYGGLVTVLAIDPQTPANLYAAGFSGVFKSSNGGASWARASKGINAPSVAAIAIDPVTPTTLYAGSIQGGVTKSVDGAATWTELLGTGAPSLVVALAIDPKTPATIYASTQQGGISKSTDSGATWATIGVATLPGFPTFKSLVIDPVTPSTIYAGDQSNGVYKSVDGGATWNPFNTGLTGPAIQILHLAIDPQTTSTLYAVAFTGGGSGLFKSTDSGGHWTLIANGNVLTYNFDILSVAVDPQTPSTVYLGAANGTFKSINGGTSFAPMHLGMPTRLVEVIAIDPANSATLYAGTIDGVFGSTNGGALWAAANNGLALTTVTAVAVDPSTPTTIYAGTSLSGLFKSTDGGASWASINTGIGSTGNGSCLVPVYTALAIDPVTTTTLYASTDCTDSSGVFKSIDGGAHWTVAATGLPAFGTIYALAIDPLITSTIYAAAGNSGQYQSTNSGGTWSADNDGLPDGFFVSSVGVTYISTVAAISARNPLALTAGKSTSRKSAPHPDASPLPIVVTYDGNHIYVKAGRSLPKILDVDDGDCPEFMDSLILGRVDVPDVQILAACISELFNAANGTNSNGFLFKFKGAVFAESAAASNDAPVQRSANVDSANRGRASNAPIANGASSPVSRFWGAPNGSNADAAACSPFAALVADPLDSTGMSFYAGAACGVLRAINLGQQIVSMNAGLPTNLQMNALGITPAGDTLYAGATSGGVHKYTLGPQLPTQLAFTNINSGFNPTAGVVFVVVVQAVAADLSSQNVAGNTTVQLSRVSGIGTLGGTLSCQIPAGSSSCTLAGVTYSVADTGVVLTATRTAGDSLTATNSPPFDVLAAEPATQLAITSVNGGSDAIVGAPFDVVVVAQAADLSVQNVVAATNVQLSVSTGAGTLGGTTSCLISAGSSSCAVTGVTYSQVDTNVVLLATATVGDPLAPGNSVPFNVDSAASPPSLVSAVSRRVHGGAGTFDLPLSLVAPPAVNHNPTTEPRQGPAQTVVFTFDKAISSATSTITEGTATAGTLTFSGNAVIVPLTGVSDKQYVTVTLSAVASTDGGSGGAAVARVGFLRGDVSQNRVVSVADLAMVNAQLAQLVTAANFLKDINASGTLSVADKALANANLTQALPAP